ncbi:MAG: hypothetical protein ACK56G_08880 [Pirellulaceae bacterium]
MSITIIHPSSSIVAALLPQLAWGRVERDVESPVAMDMPPSTPNRYSIA